MCLEGVPVRLKQRAVWEQIVAEGGQAVRGLLPA